MKLLSLNTVRKALAERSLSEFIRLHWLQIDPSDYVHGWHIDLICEHLEAANRGEIRKLLINIPPRHMKSISVAVAWPAWTWAQQKGPLMRSPLCQHGDAVKETLDVAQYTHSLGRISGALDIGGQDPRTGVNVRQ